MGTVVHPEDSPSPNKPNIEYLMARLERFRLLTNAIPSGVAYVDTNFIYRYVNATYETWFKRKAEDIVGRHVREILGEDNFQQRLTNLQRVLDGETVASQMPFVRPDGGELQMADLKYIPDFCATGEVRGIMVSVTDITPIYRIAKRAERLAKVREDFISFASHELKTPLTSLQLQQQLIIRKIEKQGLHAIPAGQVMEMLQNSQRQTDRLIQLVESLLENGVRDEPYRF